VSSVAVTALLAVFANQENMIIGLMVLYGLAFNAVLLTAMSSLGVIQASDEAPGALPGIANASYGIGASLGFAWAGPIVGSGTDTTFQHAFWVCLAIGAVALVFSIVLKPKPGPLVATVGLSH
jgi:predicted MFS family arabinose efflux permease